jgi:hypothetical protein
VPPSHGGSHWFESSIAHQGNITGYSEFQMFTIAFFLRAPISEKTTANSGTIRDKLNAYTSDSVSTCSLAPIPSIAQKIGAVEIVLILKKA